jgi:hypothetical protein
MPPGAVRALLGAAVVLVVAAIVAGGWTLVRNMTAPHAAAGAPGPAAARALRPASAAAFGPYGTGRGGSGQVAYRAIDASPATYWHTEWYATARFGTLKPGTGLLVDMGRTVTLAGARITLGSIPGAGFQLRGGRTAAVLAAGSVCGSPCQRTAVTCSSGSPSCRGTHPAPSRQASTTSG